MMEQPLAWRTHRQRLIRWYVLGGLFVIGLAGCGSGGDRSQPNEPRSNASSVLTDVARTAEHAVAVVRETLGIEASPAASMTTGPVAPRRRSSTQGAKGAPASKALPAPLPPLPTRSVAVRAHEAPIWIARSAETAEEDEHVYAQADRDVIPPTLRSAPLMNPARTADATDTGGIEVLVAKDGTVERVQLLAATSLPDMMVLSSVKTWLFEPASRNGEPVRYRLRITP